MAGSCLAIVVSWSTRDGIVERAHEHGRHEHPREDERDAPPSPDTVSLEPFDGRVQRPDEEERHGNDEEDRDQLDDGPGPSGDEDREQHRLRGNFPDA